jgi:16S rRNA (guanine527-N7)-methyltransferase
VSEPDDDKERTAFFSHFLMVSRETAGKLDRYAALLREWNEKFNLVATSTLPSLWSRHFLDSAQLIKYIPASAKTLADMGSGAGFPGLVLSIMGMPEVHLVESIGKKAAFLQAVIDELGLNTTVHLSRVEALRDLHVDIITARALKPLPELLSLAKPLTRNDSFCLFLKGQHADAELTEARKYWTFACEKTPSLSDPSGSVLKISHLKSLHHERSRRFKHR